MEKFIDRMRGKRNRPLYPFEYDQDLRFDNLFFERVKGTVAFFGGRFPCYVEKWNEGSLLLTMTVPPGSLDEGVLEILIPDFSGNADHDRDPQRLRDAIRLNGMTLDIDVNPSGKPRYAHAQFCVGDGEDHVWGKYMQDLFDADSVLKSFSGFGWKRRKKKGSQTREKSFGWEPGLKPA